MDQRLLNHREQLTNKIRKQNKLKSIETLRRTYLNKIFPLHSETLQGFQNISATDLYLYKEKIIQIVGDERLDQLDIKDYQQLVADILYLVSHHNYKFSHLEFLHYHPYGIPQILSGYLYNFHPQTIQEWILQMNQNDRELCYLNFFEDKAWQYVRPKVIESAIFDLQNSQALQLLKEYLSKSIDTNIKAFLPSLIDKLISIFNKNLYLYLSHVQIVSYIFLRKKQELSTHQLVYNLFINLNKVICNNQDQQLEFQRIIKKLKSQTIISQKSLPKK